MIETASLHAIAQAVAALDDGKLVGLPTETVYGLAADANNGFAVASIFAAKGRPYFNPLIAHVSDQAMAAQYVTIDPLSSCLMDAFWPGPLTFVLPLKKDAAIHPLVTANLPTLAIRNPKGVFADIVKMLGRPVVAPSANRSGRLSPTSAKAVLDDLGAFVAMIIDDGSCSIGVESTIIKVDNGKIFLLRPGGLEAEKIEAVAGVSLCRLDQCAAIEAPGMLQSHYAPDALLRMNADMINEGEALLAFGEQRIAGIERAVKMLNLSPSGDLREAAAHLFDYLKKLDGTSIKGIAVEPIPQTGLGEAINDRLRRAAAPRG